MSFPPEHELHKRRFGRNLGIGLSLVAFVVIVFGMTIVKVSYQPLPNPPSVTATGTKP
jgi:hypothetical protein